MSSRLRHYARSRLEILKQKAEAPATRAGILNSWYESIFGARRDEGVAFVQAVIE